MIHMAAHKAAPSIVTVPSKRGQALSGITPTPPPPDIITNIENIRITANVLAKVATCGKIFMTARIIAVAPSKKSQALPTLPPNTIKIEDASITMKVVAQVAERGKSIITVRIIIAVPSKRGQALLSTATASPPNMTQIDDANITMNVVVQVATRGKISSLEVLPFNLPNRLTIGKVHAATPISPATMMRSGSDSGTINIRAVVNPKRSIKAPITVRTKPQMDVSGFSTIAEAPIVDPRTTHQAAPRMLANINTAGGSKDSSSTTFPPPSSLYVC